jgi:hypothetical protein
VGLFDDLFYESEDLDHAIEVTLNALRAASGDLEALPAEMQVVLRVHSAQGVMDNGGLQYFFESNFEDTPPYSAFVDAFRTIGASKAAAKLAEAVTWFPFPEPHRDADARQKQLSLFEPDCGFWDLEWKSKPVWKKLDEYVQQFPDVFGAEGTQNPP